MLQVPLKGEADPDTLETVSELFLTPQAIREGFRFLPKQAEGLATFLAHGSLFAPIGVGHGKTGLSLAIAGAAPPRFSDVHRSMIFLPPHLVPQLQKDLRFWVPRLAHKPYYVPYAGLTKQKRQRILHNPVKGTYAAQYSLLSTKNFEEELWTINPDLLIFDEAHNIRDFSRPKCARIRRYIARRKAEKRPVRVVAMSGTIVHNQIRDYAHFLQWICGDAAPIPLHHELMQLWNSVIRSERKDVSAFSFDNDYSDAALEREFVYPLVTWANERVLDESETKLEQDRLGVWNAYRLRLVLAPHVTATTDDEIGVSLNFARENTPVQVPDEVHPYWKDTLASLVILPEEERKPDPDGTPYIQDILATPMQRHSVLKQLSAGFFYWHAWPEGLEQEQLDLCRAWSQARKNFNKTMSAYLKDNACPGMDSPFLVGDSMRKYGFEETGDRFLLHMWEEFKLLSVELKKMGVELEQRTKWLSDVKLRALDSWLDRMEREDPKGGGGILFVAHRAVGEAVADYIRKKLGDNRCIRALGGDNATESVIDERNRNRYIVGSYGSMSDGLNLQYHQNALFLQLPFSAKQFQQAIGRVHRNGQEADELTIDLVMNTDFEEQELWSLMQDTAFANATTPQVYKALKARYLFDLEEAPESFLRTLGFEQSDLPAREQLELRRRFGWSE